MHLRLDAQRSRGNLLVPLCSLGHLFFPARHARFSCWSRQSLGWTTVYGAAIGVVWVLFGLGFLVFLLIICVCCRFKWRSLRDGNPKYGRKQLALPLLFMLFGVLLEWYDCSCQLQSCQGPLGNISGGTGICHSRQQLVSSAMQAMALQHTAVIRPSPALRHREL